MVRIDPFERVGEPVGMAFPRLLPVGDNIEAGAFLIANRQQGCVVLRLLQKLRRYPP